MMKLSFAKILYNQLINNKKKKKKIKQNRKQLNFLKQRKQMQPKQQVNKELVKTKTLNIDNVVEKSGLKNKLDDKGVMMRNDNSQRVYYKSSTVDLLVHSITNSTSGPLAKVPQQQQQFSLSHQTSSIIPKSFSQPRIRTLKQQILRIPKVKQILQKDKLVFHQDIQKRLQLIGDLKNQKYSQEEYKKLRQLNKPLQQQDEKKKKKSKNNRRHKTNYKIPLTRNNIHSLNNIISQHIQHNQYFKNQQLIYLSQQDYRQPFDLKKLSFMQQLNPIKKMYKQKFPQFKQGVLKKNNLLLEHVILNRNIKREIKLDEKKKVKEMKQQQGKRNRFSDNDGQQRYEYVKTASLKGNIL